MTPAPASWWYLHREKICTVVSNLPPIAILHLEVIE